MYSGPSLRPLCAALLCTFALPAVLAQQAPPAPPPDLAEQLRELRTQIAIQNEKIERLQHELDEQRAAQHQESAALATGVAAVQATLERARGTGGASSVPALAAPGLPALDAARGSGNAPSPPALAGADLPASEAARGSGNAVAFPAPAEPALPVIPENWAEQDAAPPRAPAHRRDPSAPPDFVPVRMLASTRGRGPDPDPVPVGAAPSSDGRPPEVAALFEQPGVLTARGKTVVEPSFQYSYSSSNRVALVGYTIIPALLIGLLDVREVKRNTTTGTVAIRRGITNRFEVEARIPYVYRSDATVSREIFTGTATERVFNTSGRAIGDIELAARYQVNQPAPDRPYYVAGLRFKSRTGRDPFTVITDCVTRCVGDNVTGSGLPLNLPTGSGFFSLQPNLTVLFASDPAVFFGGVSYLYNFKRSDVSRTVLGGEKEWLGELAPGGVFGFNFGLGLALNEKAALSIGYDHNSVGRMRQNGVVVPGSVRTQLGTLLVGYSYRLSEKRTINITVGAGLTRDTPDVSLSLRVPFTF